jgi:TP901 family phage tail tape measure protein
MADYLTAVWNGFKVNADETENYVDKLAKVADSSASNMSELAIAMSKVAATANVMGVDVDQLTAQIATVIATTRQAPESVGTAFKTIYSRLNDIKTGADDAEISLGNYSGKMADLGFNVLDANGRLRDTG